MMSSSFYAVVMIGGIAVTAIISFVYNRKGMMNMAESMLNMSLTPEQQALLDSKLPGVEIKSKLSSHDYINASSKQRVKIIKSLSREYGVDEFVMLRRVRDILRAG